MDMIERVNELEKRVNQLESALWAVALGLPTGCCEDGRVIAAPRSNTPTMSYAALKKA